VKGSVGWMIVPANAGAAANRTIPTTAAEATILKRLNRNFPLRERAEDVDWDANVI
jgi:hypothetical protein